MLGLLSLLLLVEIIHKYYITNIYHTCLVLFEQDFFWIVLTVRHVETEHVEAEYVEVEVVEVEYVEVEYVEAERHVEAGNDDGLVSLWV